MTDDHTRKVITRKNMLRRFIKDQADSFDVCQKLKDDVDSIFEDLKAEREEQQMLAEDKKEMIHTIRQMMNECDISANEVLDVPKVKYKSGAHEWSGRGRMPKFFKECVEQGHEIEEFLV